MVKRKEKLSIYLVRKKYSEDSEIIKTDNTINPTPIEIEGAEQATLYIKNPASNTPPWTRLFTSSNFVDDNVFGFSSSVGAVFIVRALGHIFIFSFGTGFHLIRSHAIERDFGLRVTLNSVNPDKLRSLDKASFDHNPLNSRTQSTLDVDIFNLHLDSETEMLYAITGASQVPEFGSHITGRDSLTIAVETNLNSLSSILKKAIDKYAENLPEKFSWVENINRVRDSDEIELLDMELDDYLARDDISNFWLGEPEIVDWESQVGYSFNTYQNTPRHVVLSLDDYKAHLKSKLITVDSLKNDSVHVNDNEYKSVKSWPVYRCLYAEITSGSDQYILRNGLWYKVNNDFVTRVNQSLADLVPYHYTFPTYNHDREEDYNDFVAKSHSSFCLMDKKNIQIGGPYDKLEHCDLIKNGSDFIHVKYYRSSSTLSHLFAQGSVAAESFIKDSWYRQKLNPKLPASIKLSDPDIRPKPENYKVIYAIATNKNIPDELPFFSKVTLKNALKTLRALDYKVELAKIDVDPVLFNTKKYKPKKGKS